VRRWWRTGARELGHAASRRLVVRELQRYVPAVGVRDVVPGPAGIRAQAVARDGSLVDDFAFATGERVLHVLNAPSPGATAALAIADELAGRVVG
jgi:L-2-hydroxyglutarate oxidase LhgO